MFVEWVSIIAVNHCVTSGKVYNPSVPHLSENESNNSQHIIYGMVLISYGNVCKLFTTMFDTV